MGPSDLAAIQQAKDASSDAAVKAAADVAIIAILKGVKSEEDRKVAAERRTAEVHEREAVKFQVSIGFAVVVAILIVGLFAAGAISPKNAGYGAGATALLTIAMNVWKPTKKSAD